MSGRGRKSGAAMPPEVAAVRAGMARERADKDLWLHGHPPKPAGKRKNGSRGVRKVEPAQFDLHPVALLAEWYRKRRIKEPMLRAGNRFNAEVRAAHEPCVKALDLTRVRVDGARQSRLFPDGAGNWGSQEVVLGALEFCGGINSASGSVLWHIVGFEKSILQWTRAHNDFGLTRNDVPGLMYGVLEKLAKYYGFRERGQGDGGNAARPIVAEDLGVARGRDPKRRRGKD